ncbi:MAG: hypothetical protein HW391_100 [Chloroflexi bacterium]|nr:hypothetical protein [Chloroflexota bacterium]
MEHSIAAKYAARPAARFPQPSFRVRERRLGLRSAIAFRAAAGRTTVLRNTQSSQLAQLRDRSRFIKPTQPRRPANGRLRSASMTWSRSVPAGRPSPAAALWRA